MLAAIILGTIVFAGLLAYWWRDRSRDSALACLVGALGIGLVIWFAWTRAPQLTEDRQAEPLVLAIAMDLSPSMLARPVPLGDNAVLPRFERSLRVVADVIDGLQASDAHYLISITGFAGDAGVLIGWDDNLAAIREALDYTVTPELFAENGTSLEAAARSIDELFALLPVRFAAARRVVLFVSDGEDTERPSDVRYAAERLRRSNASIIALQVGLAERNEGIPVYNDLGAFQGFRVLDGRKFTRPDPDAMRELAGGRAGFFIRAEDPSASSQILEQLRSARPAVSLDTRLVPLLGMFILTFLLLLLVLK